mgnify:FL=1
MIFGGLSGVMSFFEYEFSLLAWIGNWGEAVAWFIRAGVIALGWALLEIETRRQNTARQPAQGPVN